MKVFGYMEGGAGIMSPINRVAFLVCTRNRLALLADCIASIEAQQVPDGVTVEIVIADNSEHGDEAAIRAICPRAHYAHEPRRGYSNIRNAALVCALVQTPADIFAFIDDDVVAEPNMIYLHLKTLHSYGADVSAGGNIGVGRERRARHKEGDRARKVPTSNVMFRRWIAERQRFCAEANLLGSEDMEFFYDAASAGAVIVRSPRAMVVESAAVLSIYPNIDHTLMGRVGGRNNVHLDRVRRGLSYAIYRYVKSYMHRLVKGIGKYAISTVTRDNKLRQAAIHSLAMHRGALEGLYLPGLDREMAKRGVVVPVGDARR
jgi:succinoglycan biosynthesis protein ExoM